MIISIETFMRRDPNLPEYQFLQQGHPVLQAIFAFVEHGSPSLAIAGFRLTPEGALAPFAKVIAQGDDGLGPRIVYAGSQTRIRKYLRDHRDWYNEDGKAELVSNLIQLEIPGSNGQVGGPVDIVKLTPGGSEWVRRKPECVAR